MKPLLPLLVGALLAAPGVSAQPDFSSLEERMTGREFREAGLDKLSEEELANLNDWLEQNLDQPIADTAPDGDDDSLETRQEIRRQVEEEMRAEQEGDKSEIVTTIPGHFTGWEGRTVFELANGQVWRQTTGGSHRFSVEDPTVVIYPVSFGGWRLRLEEGGPSIGVERVK